MHIENSHTRTCAPRDRGTASNALKRLVDNVAAHLRTKPDLSLVNEKFSDSFEREYTERLLHNRW